MGNSSSQSNVPDCLKSSPHFTFLAKLFQDVSTIQGNSRIVTITNFKKLFWGQKESIVEPLYKYFINSDTGQNVDCNNMQRIAFISGFDRLLKLECGSQDMSLFYFEMFSLGKQELNIEEIIRIVCSIYSVQFQQEDRNGLTEYSTNFEAFTKTLLCKGKDFVHRDDCARQMCQLCPRIFNYTHCWILRSLSKHEGSKEIVVHNHECPRIQLMSSSSECHNILDPIALWFLSASLPSLYFKSCTQPTAGQRHDEYTVSKWGKLYDSNENGLSHNRFKHHCVSYRGPTVTAILLANGVTIVLAVDVEWRESTKCFGEAGTRLYQIYPQFKVLAEKGIVLFNEKSRGVPVGLILGNNPGKPQVSLLDGLTSATLGYLGMEETSVQVIQVWGCAGMKAEADQKQQQTWEKRQAEQLQKVKLPGAWDENPDKAILEMAGMTTEHARR